MDKTVAGLLGAVSALAVSQAQAAPATPPTMNAAMQASSYVDLLRPIPNALDLLATEPEPEPEAAAPVQPVGYYYHHHHHHHHWRRRWWHHHWRYYRY